MKSPSNYGSENEETNFIRRVAAPDRPNSKRRQKKRLAIAGAAMLLVGAAAGVGFATLQSTQSNTMATQQMAANLVVPDFVETMGDPYFPSFDELDENGDGVVAYGEYMKDLNEVWDQDRENIKRSDLPDVVKQDLNNQLDDKIASDSACVKKAMVPTKKRTLSFDRKTINSLYYMLEVYCFETPIEIPQKYMDMFPETKAPVPPAPVIPEIPAPPAATEAATSAPIEVSTPGGGQQTITLVGPAVDSQQKVEIETGGGVVTTTVQVEQTASGGEKLDIPTPGGQTTTVIVPENNIPTTENGSGFKNEQQTVNVETPQGPATVTVESPVIDGKQEVTITTTDGMTTTATADVTPTENGDNELEIPGPDGTTTTVTIPSTPTEGGQGGEGGYPSEQQTGTQSPLSIQIDTATGLWTVFFNGPVTAERTQSITILKHDGSSPETVTVDVLKYTDGSLWVEVPLGPGESPRRVPIPVREGEYGTATTTTVSVMTPEGPATVETTGPVIDGKQEVTITTTDGTTTTATADVTPTENGDNELEIPGPDGTTTTVTIPSTPTEGGQGGEGGYPSEQQTGTQSPLSIQIDTATGLWTVFFNGPVTAERTQSITILKHDGSSPETVTVDVLKYTDGSLWVEVPLGPGESPRRVPIPVREGEYGTATTTTVSVMTPEGPATVETTGPVIDGKQEVTITTTDGTTTTATADVTPTENGDNELEIPGPDGTTTTVTIPSTPTEGGQGGEGGYPSEQQTGTQSPLSIQIDTATGLWTVFFNGPVTAERTQSITILKHDGSSPETVTVDVLKYTDGSLWVEVPLGPGESPRRVPIPVREGEYGTATTTTVSVMTPEGPATVETTGPVIDGKQEVTITTTDGTTTTATADVTPTENGDNELEIPGPDGTTTTVTIPSTPTEGGQGGEGGYPSEQQTGTQSPLSIQIDTATGLWTVFFNGPVTAERTQSITILKHDGSSPETVTVDVLKYTDGSLWVEVPLGPGESPRRVPIPVREGEYGTATTTTVSVMTPEGPATVETTGPVIDGKQEVTITTTDGTTTTATADVTPTENGDNELEIPGPDGTTTTVTIPSTPTEGGQGGEGGYPSEQQTGTQSPLSIQIDTATGLWTVFFNGPVTAERTQSITILKHDGSSPETVTVDVLKYTDGSLWVEVPLGPGESPRRVPIPVREGEYGTATTTTVSVMTPEGPATVETTGPVIDGKQEVTITTTDGTTTTATADVTPTENGDNELEIPGPDGTTTTVTIPSTPTEGGQGGEGGYPSEQQTGTQSPLSIQIDTATGLWTVFFNGPVTAERTQSITILKHDGSSPETVTVDVLKYTDGSLWVEVPLGPGESPRRVPIPVREGEYGTATTTTVSVMTPEGPATVETTGPVIDGTQEVTITTTDGMTTTATADVTPTENGDNELEIPGPDGTTTTVTIPSTPTEGGQGGEGGYPSEQQTGTQSPLSIQIDTATGLWTVFFNGPVTAERTQSITILKHDGSSPETVTVDVLKYTDGSLWVEVPLGPGESPRRVPIPVREGEYGTATTTTVSVMTPEGPATVETTGPVIDGKQEVTITTTDGTTTTATADVTPTENGDNELEIPGPDGTTTTVTIPSTPTEGGQGGEGGYPSEQQTGTQSPLSIQIDTATGLWTVFFNGPVTAERTQSITILKHDGSSPETVTVDVLKYTDGSLWVEVPLGPGESPRRVPIPVREGEYGTATTTTVSVMTPEGPATVETTGPVIDGKQEVTITTTDGTTTTATADVTPTENGDNELEIPGPDGTTTTVTIPSTPTEGGQGGEGGYSNEQQSVTEALPSVQVDTPEGFWTVFFDGPVNDGLQRVKLQKHDGSISVLTLFVNYRADDKMTVEIPTGPGDQTTTVFVPELSASSGQGSVPADHQQVSVTTPSGLVKVTTDSAVVDGKQQVTITTSDGRTITTAVEVTPTSDGKNALEIPTGPEGQSMIVTIPQPPSAGSTGGSGAVPQSSNAAPAPEVVVDTPQGPATVTITGPVVDDKQVVAITTPDGETTTTTVDVTKTRDGKTELEIPTGPEGSTTTVSVPSTPTQGSGGQTTTDILNQLGGNDIDNGDKDFMSKDEFQLQIGSHFSEKIMALKQQTKDEETESDKLLDQQKQLQDCILQAANKFGYFGVYEQPPYFKNAVHWVDNDCLKQ